MPELRKAKCKKCDHHFEVDLAADRVICPNCSTSLRPSRKASHRFKTQPVAENADSIPVVEIPFEEPVVVAEVIEVAASSALLEQITAASNAVRPEVEKPRRRWLGALAALCVIFMASGTAMWWLVRKPTASVKTPEDAKPTIAAVPKTETSTSKSKSRSKPAVTTKDATPAETPRVEQPSEIELEQRITVLRTSLNQKQNELTDAKRELSSMVSR